MRLLVLLPIMLVALAVGTGASAVVISTSTFETLGGVGFNEDDLVAYDIGTDTTTVPILFVGDDEFKFGENIDAVHVIDSQNILLSTQNGAQLGAAEVDIGNGDVVSYNLLTEVVTVVFSESLLGAGDVNAASLLANGNLVISTTTGESLPGVGAFGPGDLVEWDGSTGTKIFDGQALFGGIEDIDAVHVLADGSIVLSTDNDATLGGLSFDEATLVLYDPLTGNASPYQGFDSNVFGEAANIDAVFVPEPSTFSLIALGLLIPIATTRRRD